MRYKEFTETFDIFLKNLLGKDTGGLASFGLNFSSSDKDKSQSTGKTTSKDVKDIQDPDFEKKIVKVANALGIDPSNLRKIIKFETAGSFRPDSHDPNNVSVGLIGFTEKTAQGLGTSKAALAKMTAVQQLDYVYMFYKKAGLKPGSDVGTMYMLTFMPAYVNAPDNTVLGKKNGGKLGNTGLSMHMIWLQNPGFSGGGPQNKPGSKTYFTVGDVKRIINSR